LHKRGRIRYTSVSVILRGSEDAIRVQEPPAPIARQGKVVSRLAALQARAGELWGVRVTQRMLAEVTGIPLKMIQALCKPPRRQTIKRLNLLALGKLCWLFDCDIDQLLAYLPPGAPVSSLPPVQIRRKQPPEPGVAPPQAQLIHTRLPEALSTEKIVAVMRATGKKRDTIAAIRNGKPIRIRPATLAALCDAAYRKDPHAKDISGILVSMPFSQT
jgi:DNA-binding Xre family transcriptional regulator